MLEINSNDVQREFYNLNGVAKAIAPAMTISGDNIEMTIIAPIFETGIIISIDAVRYIINVSFKAFTMDGLNISDINIKGEDNPITREYSEFCDNIGNRLHRVYDDSKSVVPFDKAMNAITTIFKILRHENIVDVAVYRINDDAKLPIHEKQ